MGICSPATVTPTKKVRDIISNSLSWKEAYGECAARMQCLVGWLRAAASGDSQPDCAANAAKPAKTPRAAPKGKVR